MIKVTQFIFSKSDFTLLPKDERALIILAGQTLNLVNVWIKLVRISSEHEPSRPFEQKLSAAQTQILLRSLFGTLHEAWVWLTRKDLGPLVSHYLPYLPEDARQARKLLSRHLADGGLMDSLRNGFAFHQPSTDALNKAFTAMPEDEDWSWYVTDEHSSSLYLSCETVVGYGVAGVKNHSDLNVGYVSILEEVLNVANAMNLFMTVLLATAIQANAPKKPQQVNLEVNDAPHIKAFSLPFYIEGI